MNLIHVWWQMVDIFAEMLDCGLIGFKFFVHLDRDDTILIPISNIPVAGASGVNHAARGIEPDDWVDHCDAFGWQRNGTLGGGGGSEEKQKEFSASYKGSLLFNFTRCC